MGPPTAAVQYKYPMANFEVVSAFPIDVFQVRFDLCANPSR
jgi:hypothetical protein